MNNLFHHLIRRHNKLFCNLHEQNMMKYKKKMMKGSSTEWTSSSSFHTSMIVNQLKTDMNNDGNIKVDSTPRRTTATTGSVKNKRDSNSKIAELITKQPTIDPDILSIADRKERTMELKRHLGYDERAFEELNVDKYKELMNEGNSLEEKIKIEKQISLILSEYEYTKYTTLDVPSTLTLEEMSTLLTLENEIERARTINFLYGKEVKKMSAKVNRIAHSEEYWSRKREEYKGRDVRTGIFDSNGNIIYGLWHNTLFTKLYQNICKRMMVRSRERTAALFGQKIIIDLDFDRYMKIKECQLLCRQLQILYGNNCYQFERPFDLHFVNADSSMPTMINLPRFVGPNIGLDKRNRMISIHERSYIDVFGDQKERLVYLTPHAAAPLMRHNEDDIYIIGGLIDKTYKEPFTYVKAKKEGIRAYRLPIDEHMAWGSGKKFLCLNHVVSILHDWSITNDWKSALKKHVPFRKQKPEAELVMEEEIRKIKYRRQKELENMKGVRNFSSKQPWYQKGTQIINDTQRNVRSNYNHNKVDQIIELRDLTGRVRKK